MLKMKHLLSFILLIVIYSRSSFGSENTFNKIKDIGFATRSSKNRNQDNIGDILRNKRFDYGIINNEGQGIFGRSDHKFAFDEGNPDIHGRIERPCQAYDSFCIRKFFSEHSHCKISGRRIPDPFRTAQSNVNFPSANMSVTTVETMFEGLNNARVAEFYINKATDNLVIAFSFDAISLASNNTNVRFYLRGREPEVHNGFGALTYLQITITLIIPGLDNLRLDRAEIYTYAENPVLPFVVGPSLGVSSDPEVVAMFLYFGTVGVPVEHLEELSTIGVLFGTTYLQYNICDFGLKAL